MHKDDQMTPMQRLQGFLTGGEMDRILTMPFIMSVSGKAAGMTHKQKRATAESEAQCQIANYEMFGNDLLIIEYGLHSVGIELGSQMSDEEDATPRVVRHVIDKIEGIDTLDFSKALPENSPIFQQKAEAVKILVEKLGSEVPTGALMCGPLTAASSIIPVDKLLRATRKNPEAVHRLMRACTDVLKQIHAGFIKQGAMILFCEPIGTGDIVSRKQFQEFVKPYLTELMGNIHDCGGMVCLHICGDTTAIVPDMVECGPDMVSIDNRVDLAYAKSIVEPFMPLVGNIDPLETLVFGTREDIFEESKKCIEVGYNAAHGYVFATGCDLNVNVPLENIQAMMDAARTYGKLPVNPENWD